MMHGEACTGAPHWNARVKPHERTQPTRWARACFTAATAAVTDYSKGFTDPVLPGGSFFT